MSIVEQIFSAGIGSTAKAVGGLAKDIRTAITGKESIDSAAQLEILRMAHELETAATRLEHEVTLGQIEINKIEASSESIFKSGWRPAAAWSCIAGAIWYPIIRLLLPWSIQVYAFFSGADMAGFPALPALESEVLFALLSGLLGFGTMRTIDKKKKK